MTQQEFEEALRHFLRREPFQPFVVELLDGRFLFIDGRSVAFDNGNAVFLAPDYDLVDFTFQEVREIRDASHEMAQ